MKNYRRVYLDVFSGDYHAKFIGDSIKSIVIQDTFTEDIIVIPHNQNTTGVIMRVYDDQFNEIYLDNFTIVDENTVETINRAEFTGFIKLIFFPTTEDNPSLLEKEENDNVVKVTKNNAVPRSIIQNEKAFITVWKTDNDGGSKNKIVIPLQPNMEYSFTIDWGDSTKEFYESSNMETISHNYEKAGTYEIKITGKFPTIFFSNSYPKNISRNKLLKIKQWGSIKWETFKESFEGCENLKIEAVDVPDLSNANGPFLRSTFKNCKNFTSNDSIDKWSVFKCTSLKETFLNCEKFNSPLSSWDVSNVKISDSCFENAKMFNSDISNWNTESLQRCYRTFHNAISFDVSIGKFNMEKVIDARGMLDNVGMSVDTYDDVLICWGKQKLQPALQVGVSGLEFSSKGEKARQIIKTKYRWEMVGDTKI